MKNEFLILLLLATISLSCKHERPKPKSDEEVLSYKEPLVKVNKILVDRDSLRISAYCKRKQLSLTVSSSGLWYKIEHTGKGDSAKIGKIANLKYKIYLLDGKLCYSSDSLGIKSFKIGEGGVETGLEIGIRMLREGDKATFILPPNLAYGLLGDEKRIPARSIILYQIELTKLTDF
jgi:FKBP-type peptidyl-prolyl cis-trans isomerase